MKNNLSELILKFKKIEGRRWRFESVRRIIPLQSTKKSIDRQSDDA
jgi:hypothetical protein